MSIALTGSKIQRKNLLFSIRGWVCCNSSNLVGGHFIKVHFRCTSWKNIQYLGSHAASYRFFPGRLIANGCLFTGTCSNAYIVRGSTSKKYSVICIFKIPIIGNGFIKGNLCSIQKTKYWQWLHQREFVGYLAL